MIEFYYLPVITGCQEDPIVYFFFTSIATGNVFVLFFYSSVENDAVVRAANRDNHRHLNHPQCQC